MRIDHIDEHPTRRQEFAVIVEKCQQEVNDAVGILCEFMQEPDNDPIMIQLVMNRTRSGISREFSFDSWSATTMNAGESSTNDFLIKS